MLSQRNYERYIHYRDHVRNPHINYIRLSNCKYCKQDKRDYYGLQHSSPNRNRNHYTNMNLLNFDRVRNILNIDNLNQSNINSSYNNPLVINHRPRQSRIRRIFNPFSRILPRFTRGNSNTNSIIPPNTILRNNYVSGNVNNTNVNNTNVNNTNVNNINNNLNLNYFMNNFGIRPIQDDEIQDFEEFTDVEIKTLHETVNKETEIEVFYESKKGYCTICCEDIIYSQIIRKFKCGHTFHYKCIDEWLENNTKCPICRYDINC